MHGRLKEWVTVTEGTVILDGESNKGTRMEGGSWAWGSVVVGGGGNNGKIHENNNNHLMFTMFKDQVK